MKNYCLQLGIIMLLSACNNTSERSNNKKDTFKKNDTALAVVKPVADRATILAKKEVPILCYHDIRNGSPAHLKTYTVTPDAFAAQMKILSDSGYTTILPDDLYAYLVHGAILPKKPVMITFDDTDKDHYTVGAAEMKRYGFKGAFFLMTIAINRKRYMTEEEIKELSDDGHSIQAHTWDHHMATKYKGSTWDSQLVLPKKRIEAITGKPVQHFAYPFGLWSSEAIPELKNRGYKMAFILSTKRDSTEPLFTIRRMIVPGQWSPAGMLKAMKTTFR